MGAALALLADRDAGGLSGSLASPVAATRVNKSLTLPSSGEISPREQVWNVVSFRRAFPGRWAEYLRETYQTAYAVQKAFPGIDSKTARDWISGKRDPSASLVIAECIRNESALQTLGRME